MKYSVEITQKVTDLLQGCIEVEAASEDEAKAKAAEAMNSAAPPELDFHYQVDAEPWEIQKVTEIKV